MLPGVGRNLQDHVTVMAAYRRAPPAGVVHRSMRIDRIGWELAKRYLGERDGRIADPVLRDRVAAVFAKAIKARTAKDQWDGELFGWYLGLATTDSEQVKSLLTDMFERDLFTKQNILLYGQPSPICSALTLMRSICPSLSAKFGGSWAEDRMVAEIKKTGQVHLSYWTQLSGNDARPKVVNAAADWLAANPGYPFIGTLTAPATYTREQYAAVINRALGADAALAAAFRAKFEGEFGHTRFDSGAAGFWALRELSVATPEARKAFFDRLRNYVERARQFRAGLVRIG